MLVFAQSEMLENEAATAEITVNHFKIVLAPDGKLERDTVTSKKGWILMLECMNELQMALGLQVPNSSLK